MKHLWSIITVFAVFLTTTITAQQEIPATTLAEVNQALQHLVKEELLPKEANIEKVIIEDSKATLYFQLPEKFLKYLNASDLDEVTEHLLPLLPDLKANDFFFVTKNRLGEHVALDKFLPPVSIPQSYEYSHKNGGNMDPNPSTTETRYTAAPPMPSKKKGALAGKTVWLSAGHGWRWKTGEWKTQRLNDYGAVEDFSTIESVNYYLIKYLENAGANVWTVRERDMNTNEVIVDDASSGYRETGSWSKSTSQGFDKNYRYIYTQAKETGKAIFTPDIKESGYYWVSIYYRNGANRCKDTRFTVHHAGGESKVSINQEVHGLTWVYLGQYYFEKGTKGKVELSNQSSDVGQAIIADAVRFGGGMGTYKESGEVSQKPRFEEAAKYFANYQGYQSREGDVTVRPEYAEWELAKGSWQERSNAIYLAWHTNAGGGKGTGTETFMYNRGATKGSNALRNAIHKELVGDIRKEWDADWYDRGLKSANFGELRRLKTMPGALVEIAFHDHEDDSKALLTPKFRNISARAVYQGIVKYFAQKDGKKVALLPEAPTHLSAKNSGTGRISLKWRMPKNTPAGGNDPTAYKIYISKHGKGFPDGIEVSGTSHTFTNLESNTTYYFKVSASNQGGESFTTAVVAARTPKKGQQKVDFLVVDGFDRLDRYSAITQYDGKRLGNTKRLFLERMNRFDYAVEHAKGLESAGLSFDGSVNEAVADADITLNDYKGVNWFLGEESTQDVSLNYAERKRIESYLNGGGSLMISGSEHSFDLARKKGRDINFFKNYLKSIYKGDDADTYKFKGVSGILDNLDGLFDDSKSGYYDIDYPDRLSPVSGAFIALKYDGGSSDGAAIAYAGRDFRVINFGFPLETVTDEKVRNQLIARSAQFLVKGVDFKPIDDFKGTKGNTNKGVDVKPTPKKTNVERPNLPNPANITPNPFKTAFTVNLKNIRKGKAKMTIRDSRGKKVGIKKWRHKTGNSERINIILPPGTYSYEVKVGRKKLKGKLLRVL